MSLWVFAEAVPGVITDYEGEWFDVFFVRMQNDTVEYYNLDNLNLLKKIYKLDLRRIELKTSDSVLQVDLDLSDFEWEITKDSVEQIADVEEPEKGFAYLLVKSNPEGARVYVDGVLTDGVTPLILEDLAAKKSQIMVRKYLKGVDWWGSLEVELVNGDTTEVEIKLLKPHTQFSVQTVPTDVEVYIDNRPSLNTMPKYISDTVITNIRPGPHRHITFFKEGYYDTTVVVDIEAFMPNLIGVDLRIIKEDLIKLDEQLNFAKSRKKRWVGRGMWYSAIIPVLSSGVLYYLANSDWAKAADYKYMYEDAAFHSTETDRFIKENSNLNDSGDLKAKIAAGIGTVGLALVLTGIVLHF
ncbi:MAG: PEGA domain-containing protein [Fibrobacter sp.]|nr:PEGA domain-containing protein [Fibrobacter sp.]